MASTSSNLTDAVNALRAAGYRVQEPPPPEPEHRCLVVGCGRTDEENKQAGFGPLIDVELRVAFGEEGTANPVRYVCYLHSDAVFNQLAKLGFGVHRHGGINYLEPEDCPGCRDMDACPTPVVADEWGREFD